MTTLYLASAWARRAELRTYAEALRSEGLSISSSWLTGMDWDDPDFPRGRYQDRAEFERSMAVLDLGEIGQASAVVVFTGEGGPGHHVEFGYALGLNKTVCLVGPKMSLFHALVTARFDDFGEFFAARPWVEATP